MRYRKLIRFFVAAVHILSRLAGSVAIVFLLSIMLLTVIDVFLRYFFNSPIPGSLEISQYFMVIAGFLGLAWCALKGGHIKVNLIINKFSQRKQNIIEGVTMLFSLSVLPLIAWQCFAQARYALLEKNSSDLLDIPEYPFFIVMGIGFILLMLAVIVLMVQLIAGGKKDES